METKERQLPAKVNLETLRAHFKLTYNLTDDQIDVMLEASAKSLTTSFSTLYTALETNDLEQVFRTAHSVKGLLLNLGEKEWAALARQLELAASKGEERGYKSLVTQIYEGVGDIL